MKSVRNKKHDLMVEYVARQLKRRFYEDIRARSYGYRPPARVPGDSDQGEIVPDVTMVAKGAELNVLEVETPETLRRAETARRLRAVAEHTEKMGGRLWVVVPRGGSSAALKKLRSLEVNAKVWEVEPEVV